jgi:hypothetical protein
MSAAAAMKAGFFRTQADCTETNWSQRLHASGPFRFGYDYQRADLDITGPDPYPALLPEHRVGRVIYTSGGMAAIATVLITLRAKDLAIHFPAGVYAETKELASLLTIPNGDAVTFIDSAAPVSDLNIGVNSELAILDTSCFVATSGKLRSWARRLLNHNSTLVLARSHVKLDMLGTEYGRLGSLVVLSNDTARVTDLHSALLDTVRLIGAAPQPEDFPPFVGDEMYPLLTRGRTAQIITNTRHLRQALHAASIPCVPFQHGLFLDVELPPALTRTQVSHLAQSLADTVDSGAIRHAGSFGFDFTATEWTEHPLRADLALRIAPGDQPCAVFAPLSLQLARSLKELLGKGAAALG